jgi:DNA-binding MarR family transcriptional regulator
MVRRAIIVRMTEMGLAWMLLEAFRSMDSEIQAALRDRGISDVRPSHARAMLLVDRAGTRLADLSQRAQVTKQAMMQVVDDLVSLGLVRRVPDPADARAKLVKLTAKGLRQRAEARRALASVDARIKRHLGDRRYDALRVALAEVSSGEE